MVPTPTDKTQCELVVPPVVPPGTVERDDSFYFEDDPMTIFRVENRLFRVHRHNFIRGSAVFRDMFSLPTPKDPEGTCDEQPISLPDVTLREFQMLLKFFYFVPLPSSYNLVEGDDKSWALPGVTAWVNKLKLEEKLALLSISHRFLFGKIFKCVVNAIKPGDIAVVERIRLGDKYGLQEWLSSAYETLLARTPGKLFAQEVDVLGSQRVASLFSVMCSAHENRLNTAQMKIGRLEKLIKQMQKQQER